MLKGTAATAGIGIGTVLVVEEADSDYTPHAVEDTGAEKAALQDRGRSPTSTTRRRDPYMQGEMVKLIEGGMCAEDALVQICDMFATMFEATGDELTMQRATDVRDVKTGVLAELLNKREVKISDAPAGTILLVKELTPSMTAGINKDNIVGIITETGGKTSHSAILARALEIPAVLSVENAASLMKTAIS